MPLDLSLNGMEYKREEAVYKSNDFFVGLWRIWLGWVSRTLSTFPFTKTRHTRHQTTLIRFV